MAAHKPNALCLLRLFVAASRLFFLHWMDGRLAPAKEGASAWARTVQSSSIRLYMDDRRPDRGRSTAKIAPQQLGQPRRRQDRDGFALDLDELLLAEFGQRAGEGFTHRAEFGGEHALR